MRTEVHLQAIVDNPWQPRMEIEEEGLAELAQSIEQLGLLQAPLGRYVDNGQVQLAFGHRRVAAIKKLHAQGGWQGDFLDMDVREISDEDMAVLALTENERRKNLTPIEVVRAHKKALDETKLTIQALADQLGQDRSTLSNNLRVLDLPDVVLEHVDSGEMALSTAREFLVLQNSIDGHCHLNDMELVIRDISGRWGQSGAPDWSRRYVRKTIYDRVKVNEKDFRPLGPKGPKQPWGYEGGGAHRESAFDVEEFSAERRHLLHTIPQESDDRGEQRYEGSRVWTCDVKAWKSWQSKATREANKEAVTQGKAPPKPSNKSVPREKQLEGLLADDPVWKKIAVSRETPGPNRPVTEAEKEQLGTRAELHAVGYDGFWKILEMANPQDVYSWERQNGGLLPPFFPDLKECKRCTIGAAYATSPSYSIMNKPTLVCLNRQHYREKLEAGEAAYKAKVAEHKLGMQRQDEKMVEKFKRTLAPLPPGALKSMLVSLASAGPQLHMQHPLGVYHKDFSYVSTTTERVRELLSAKFGQGDWRSPPVARIDQEKLRGEVEAMTADHLPELVATLLVHHLRVAGEVDTFSWEAHTPGAGHYAPSRDVNEAYSTAGAIGGQRSTEVRRAANAERDTEIRELAQAGKGSTEIARLKGISRGSVRKVLERANGRNGHGQ